MDVPVCNAILFSPEASNFSLSILSSEMTLGVESSKLDAVFRFRQAEAPTGSTGTSPGSVKLNRSWQLSELDKSASLHLSRLSTVPLLMMNVPMLRQCVSWLLRLDSSSISTLSLEMDKLTSGVELSNCGSSCGRQSTVFLEQKGSFTDLRTFLKKDEIVFFFLLLACFSVTKKNK